MPSMGHILIFYLTYPFVVIHFSSCILQTGEESTIVRLESTISGVPL
jgi:hypothetical protein